MEVAISHRNHNIAGPHPDGTASLIIGGMVRIEGQRGLGHYQGVLLPLCKNIFGFVATLCQASYKSNAKTTSCTRPPEHPHRRSRESGNPGQGRFPSPFALSLSKACPEGTRRACPEGTRRGPPPPKHTLTRAPGAQANAPVTLPPCNTHAMTSTRTSPQLLRRGAPRLHRACRQSPPLPRRQPEVVSHGRKSGKQIVVAGTNTPATKIPRAATPARETTSWRSRRPAPAAPASNQDPRRQEIGEVAKGGVPERC